MNNRVSDSNRATFFPQQTKQNRAKSLDQIKENFDIKRKNPYQKEPTAKASPDSKVDIASAVKDFSKIKKAVDMSPELDNSSRIASLKQQIQSGNYKIDYDKVADKMLSQGF